MEGTQFSIEETLLGVLRPLLVGKRCRVSRRRKPRVCVAVELGWREHEHADESGVGVKYEDGTEEFAQLYGDVEVFD